MRALISEICGPADTLVLGELPEPVPGPGQVRVAIEACGINYPDVLLIEDRYQFKAQRPFAPGIEICGLIDAVGPDVVGFEPGQRVLAQVSSGGLAEKAVVGADRPIPVPAGVTAERAASVLLTYGTSYYALKDRASLKPGETLLVLGAAGGVGLAAVQLGKLMGANVVAAVSSEAKAEAARAAGADATMIYPVGEVDQRALTQAFKAACPAGADVIYDAVGGGYAEPAFRTINWDGRYLVVGFPAGIPSIPFNLPLLKGAQIVGVFWGGAVERDVAALKAEIAEVLEWMAAGKLAPAPSTIYPLERGGDAIAALAGRQAIGKLVVRI